MMRRKAWVTVLALFVNIVPMGLAQTSQKPKVPSMQPGTQLIAWTQDQKPEPVPSPKPVPLPDRQQPEQRPETPPPSQPVSGQQDQNAKQPATQTFSGLIMKAGDKYVLKGTDSTTYQLDDQQRAKEFEGKQVQITGSLDPNSNTIKVQSIKPAA